MSKGSTQRPTDKKSFDENYDKIFGKKEARQSDAEFLASLDDPAFSEEDDSFWTEYAR